MSITTLRKRLTQYDAWWLLLGLSGSALLQLYFINASGFWHDESFSSLLARLPPAETIARTANDVHPPLYYLLLHGWSSVFGFSDAALRSFSVVCLLLALGGLYFLLKRYVHPVAARFGLLIAALGPFTLRYGVEARMYTLAALLLVGATWCLLSYLESGARRFVWFYTLAIAALLYTHYFTFPVVLIHGLYLYWRQFGGRGLRLSRLGSWVAQQRWWLLSLGGVAVLFAPWAPVAIRQTASVSGGFWVAQERLIDPLNTLIFYQSNIDLAGLSAVLIGLFVAGFAVIAFGFWRAWQQAPAYRRPLLLLLAMGTLPLLIVLAVSYALPQSSVYVDRYFSFFALWWYVALGTMLWLQRPRSLLQIILVALISGQFSFGIYNLGRLGNFNWDRPAVHDMRATMAFLNQNYRSGDAIVADDLYIYFDAAHYNAAPVPVQVRDPGYSGGNASLLADRAEILIGDYDELPAGTRLWLISIREHEPDLPADWQVLGPAREFKLATLQRYEVR